MSWAGVLEHVQRDIADLLTLSNKAAIVERKQVLLMSALMDEETAQSVIDHRIATGLCASWLCPNVVEKKAATAPAGAGAGDSSSSSPAISKGTGNTNPNCCSSECSVALFHLLKRAKEFDPTSQHVSEALFKLFPKARDNIDDFVEFNKREQEAKRQKRTEEYAAAAAAAGAPKKKTAAAAAQNDHDDDADAVSKQSTMPRQRQFDPSGPLPGSNSAAIQIRERIVPGCSSSSVRAPVAGNRLAESSTLLFSALDPRIAVVVLTDLVLPPTLKRRWTRQLAKNFNRDSDTNSSSGSGKSNLWLEALPGGAELVSKCTARAAEIQAAHEQMLKQRAGDEAMKDDDISDDPSSGPNHTSTQELRAMLKNGNRDAVLAAHNSFRAREIASEVLTTVVVAEARRCALLLRLDCEMPMEFGAALDDLLNRSFSIPTPVPYEDSKDTWLLFVVFLYGVLSLTDSQMALRLGDRPPKALPEILEAFCVEPNAAKDILFAFFDLE